MDNITLRLWQDDDLFLLHGANTPEMTAHQNGPETDDQIYDRHARYLRYIETGEARMFAILIDAVAVGSIGYWKVRWNDQDAWEAGWFVLPEAQGHGIAARALTLMRADLLHHDKSRHTLVAFPAVDNPPSNAVCRRAGFALIGSTTVTFRGAPLAVNEWASDLTS